RAPLARAAGGLALGVAIALAPPVARGAEPGDDTSLPDTAPVGAAGGAAARGDADLARATRAYCEHVSAVAASEGALLRAPWLFSSIGTLRGSGALDADVTGGNLDRELSLRLQAGLGFSPTRYYLAGLLEDQAKAECERHRAEEELRAFGGAGGSVPRSALEAKIAVYREALPRAQALLKKSLDALEASRTTVQEHEALALRVDGLRDRLASSELALAALPPQLEE